MLEALKYVFGGRKKAMTRKISLANMISFVKEFALKI